MYIWRYLGAHVEINECAKFIQFTSSLLILLVHKSIIIPDNRGILNIFVLTWNVASIALPHSPSKNDLLKQLIIHIYSFVDRLEFTISYGI